MNLLAGHTIKPLSELPDRHPLGDYEMFSESDDAAYREIHERCLALPADLSPVAVVCFFDYIVQLGHRYNNVATVAAAEALLAECREVNDQLLATLRAGDLDMIRRMVHGGSFSVDVAGGTAILTACEPPSLSVESSI